jgi:diacylglycerol kinase (ATP)
MDLGILDEKHALQRLLAGEVRAIDMARVDLEAAAGIEARTLLAANVLAWGAGARINRRAEGMRWAGAARYNVATVVELLAMGRGAAVSIVDGVPRPGDLLGVASLTRYSGRGLLLAPEARLDDGKIDLVHIGRSSRLHLARTFGAVFRGAHLGLAGVSWTQVESFRLELGEAGELVVDGELVPCNRAKITVLPRALSVIA